MHYKQVQANRGNTSIHSFYVYKRECMKINMLHTDLANMSCKKTSPICSRGVLPPTTPKLLKQTQQYMQNI